MQLGKVLIVDDLTAIREIAKFYLEAIGECTFLEASSGNDAEKLIQDNPDINLVFSDYNMHFGNGATVLQALREKSNAPFILHTGDRIEDHPEFAGAKNIFHAEKPLTVERLTEILEQAMPQAGPPPTIQPANYLPVQLSLLRAMRKVKCPLYIGITDSKFVRTYHAGTEIPPEDLKKYEDRGVKYLYIERDDFHTFISEFQKFTNEVIEADKRAGTNTLANVTSSSVDFVSLLQDQMGLSAEVYALTKKNIELVLEIANKNEQLRTIAKNFSNLEGSRFSRHCILTALIATSIGKNLHWVSDQTSVKFAFAAILHDSQLPVEEWERHSEFQNSEAPLKNLNEKAPTTDVKNFMAHSSKAADIAKRWQSCPPDVDLLILQHHEKPNGTGIPGHITAPRINPLSAVFVIAHHLAMDLLASNGEVDIKNWVEQHTEYYSHGDFKKAITHVLNE